MRTKRNQAVSGGRLPANPVRGAGDERLHLMIVDDDDDLRTLWEMEIGRWRLPVRLSLARDGFDAIKKMASDPPGLLITDSSMPWIDGHVLVGIMSRVSPYDLIPVVVYSGGNTKEMLDYPSVIACVPKHRPLSDLREVVEAWCLTSAPH